MQMPCFASAIPGKYMLHAFSSGGMVLRWYRDVFCELEMQTEESGGEIAFDRIDRVSAEVAPGCDGLIMIPHLQGSGPPDTDNNAKGVYFGITLAHKKAHFSRAILESVAMILRTMIQAMENLGLSIDRIIALGGGAKSMFWCQLKSDATGLPVSLMKNNESAACLGAAILAGVSAGIWETPEQAADAIIREDKTLEPRKENKPAYDELFRRYVELQKGLKPLFRL